MTTLDPSSTPPVPASPSPSSQPLRVSVIGTGYLGATHAACMAELGFEVLGVDVDAEQGRRARRGPGPLLRARSRASCSRKHVESGRLALHHRRRRRRRRSATSTSSASAPRRSTASTPPTCATSTPAIDALAPHLRRPSLVVGKSTVPVGTAARLAERVAELAPAGAASSSPGTRSSCARASPSTTRCTRTGWSSAYASAASPRRCCGRCTRRCWTAGVAAGRHRLRRPPSWSRSPPTPSSPPRSRSSTRWRRCARRAGADVVELAEALGARPADRRPVPDRRPRVRRRLPAQGHPGVHGAGRRARRRPGADLPAARSTRSTCAAARAWSTWRARPCGGSLLGQRGSRCSARRSSPTPTTSVTRRRSTWPRCSSSGGAQVTGVRPEGE